MTPLTGPLAHWPTDSPNYKEMLSHLKNILKKITLHCSSSSIVKSAKNFCGKTLGRLDKRLKSHYVWKVWKLIETRKEKRGEIPLLLSSGGVSIHHQVLSKFRNPIKTNLDIFLYLISPIYHCSITDINWNIWNKNLFLKSPDPGWSVRGSS